MNGIIRYVAVLLILGLGDAIWLSYFAHAVFKPTLGEIVLENPRWAAVVVFYFGYAAGIMIFAVLPALAAGSAWKALLYGALFGLFAYGTYDVTNFATLRAWTLPLALLDTGWGVLLTAAASLAGFLATWRS